MRVVVEREYRDRKTGAMVIVWALPRRNRITYPTYEYIHGYKGGVHAGDLTLNGFKEKFEEIKDEKD